MNTMVESAWKNLAAFTHSDVYGTSPLWHILLTAMVVGARPNQAGTIKI